MAIKYILSTVAFLYNNVSGVTGPVMVYDEALFKFSKSAEVEYLPWRVWISFWCLIIAATVACFQGSFVVKYFTKFTKDIFASFIATVFIIEALLKTAGVSFPAQVTCSETHHNYPPT